MMAADMVTVDVLSLMSAGVSQSSLISSTLAKEIERLRKIDAVACTLLGVPQADRVGLVELKRLCRH